MRLVPDAPVLYVPWAGGFWGAQTPLAAESAGRSSWRVPLPAPLWFGQVGGCLVSTRASLLPIPLSCLEGADVRGWCVAVGSVSPSRLTMGTCLESVPKQQYQGCERSFFSAGLEMCSHLPWLEVSPVLPFPGSALGRVLRVSGLWKVVVGETGAGGEHRS